MTDFGKMKPQWRPSESGTKSPAEDPQVKDLDVTEPEVPPTMSTNIIADNVSGVAIQQGSSHSTQHVGGQLNVQAAQAAMAGFANGNDAALNAPAPRK